MEKINESVLDPIQKNRCEALFDINDHSTYPVIKQETKDFIIGLLNKFRDETGLQFNYDEAFIVGSSLGYQYKDDSDIDIDVRADLGREFFKGKFHFIPKNVMLPGTAHPINIYLLTKEDPPYNFEKDAENAYDLLTDTWIKQGRLSNETAIPYEYIAGVSEFIMDGMALELHRAERDMYDMEKYLRLDPAKVAITVKDRNDAISKKISDLIIDKDALALAHTFMFRLDRDGFNDDPINVSIKYKHDSRHYSMNNLIYKYIDSFKYYEKINAQIDSINKLIETAKKDLETSQLDVDTPETRNTAEAQQEVIDSATTTTDEQQPAEEEAIEESWTDNELRNILSENGYSNDDENLKLLKENLNDKLVLIPGSDIELEDLEESIQEKTERKINRIISKKSGKINELVASGLGFLISGSIGTVLFHDLAKDHNENNDYKHNELISAVENDEKCSEILSEIKLELKQETPDKSKLRKLKNNFAKAVVECKKKLKKEEQDANSEPKISLKENLTNEDLLDILKNNGYAPTEKNLKILKENTNYVLEEGNENEN